TGRLGVPALTCFQGLWLLIGHGGLAARWLCGLSWVSWSSGLDRWPFWRCGVRGPGRGWSGRGCWRRAGSGAQGHPFVLAVPACGEVEGDVAAAVAGGAGGDVDEVAADGGAAGLAVGEAGQG